MSVASVSNLVNTPVTESSSVRCSWDKCPNALPYIGTLKKCSACKKVFYCDQGCQRGHWPSHKIECISPVRLSNESTKALDGLSSKANDLVQGLERVALDVIGKRIDQIEKSNHPPAAISSTKAESLQFILTMNLELIEDSKKLTKGIGELVSENQKLIAQHSDKIKPEDIPVFAKEMESASQQLQAVSKEQASQFIEMLSAPLDPKHITSSHSMLKKCVKKMRDIKNNLQILQSKIPGGKSPEEWERMNAEQCTVV